MKITPMTSQRFRKIQAQKVEPSIGECFDTWTVFTSHRASPKSINHKNPSTCPTGKNLGLSPADEANGKRFSSENKGRTWAKKKCENVIFPNRRVIFRLCSRGPVEHISSQMVGVDLRPNCGEPWNVEGRGGRKMCCWQWKLEHK